MVPSHLQRPKCSPALMAARFVTIGLSNEASSPGRIPPVDGQPGLGFGLLMEVWHSPPARRPVDQFGCRGWYFEGPNLYTCYFGSPLSTREGRDHNMGLFNDNDADGIKR
jgi:hypothetical protein